MIWYQGVRRLFASRNSRRRDVGSASDDVVRGKSPGEVHRRSWRFIGVLSFWMGSCNEARFPCTYSFIFCGQTQKYPRCYTHLPGFNHFLDNVSIFPSAPHQSAKKYRGRSRQIKPAVFPPVSGSSSPAALELLCFCMPY